MRMTPLKDLGKGLYEFGKVAGKNFYDVGRLTVKLVKDHPIGAAAGAAVGLGSASFILYGAASGPAHILAIYGGVVTPGIIVHTTSIGIFVEDVTKAAIRSGRGFRGALDYLHTPRSARGFRGALDYLHTPHDLNHKDEPKP